MIWILLILLLALVFGVGTLVEAALWTMLLVAAFVAVGVLALRRVLPHERRGAVGGARAAERPTLRRYWRGAQR